MHRNPRSMFVVLALLVSWHHPPAHASENEVLFRNVRIFDGNSTTLSAPADVLVRGDRIAEIGTGLDPSGASVIEGESRTLMPGLIDAHAHIMFAEMSKAALASGDIGFANLVAGRTAERMLAQGFTSIRDAGGPAFGLKRAIDSGIVSGPRIWPSGAIISQTAGHGDFRLPNEVPAVAGELAYADRLGVGAVADGVDLVRMRTREQLRMGASQIKLAAGGGVSSSFDPLDVTQYSLEEIRAAVEAAEDWGTYVMVHAYTPRAIQRAIEAGVRSIEHGHLADEATARLMAKNGIWWNLQPFLDDEDANPQTGAAREKQKLTQAGTETAYELARKFKIKTSWGSDTLYSPGKIPRMNYKLAKLRRWYSGGEILRMATGQNGELLALSGNRSPYGRVGVVEPGALADLILVDGDPVADITLIENPEENFLVIMKGGVFYRNALGD